MTLTGPESEPELMKSMILAGVQIQMPIGKDEQGNDIFPERLP